MDKKSRRAELESAVVELRYPPAYLLWDRAGAVWSRLAEELPDLVVSKAEPRSTVFNLGDRFQLAVEFERALIRSAWPDENLSEFSDIVTKLTNTIVQELRITAFKRIGFRCKWATEGVSMDSVSDAVRRLEWLRPPDNVFGIKDAALSQPELGFRWENDALGVYLQIKSERRQLSVNAPMEISKFVPEIPKKETFHVSYDLDYYTKDAILIGQLKIGTWLAQAYDSMKKGVQAHMVDFAS